MADFPPKNLSAYFYIYLTAVQFVVVYPADILVMCEYPFNFFGKSLFLLVCTDFTFLVYGFQQYGLWDTRIVSHFGYSGEKIVRKQEIVFGFAYGTVKNIHGQSCYLLSVFRK